MKNSLLIFLFLIFAGSTVNAQENVLFGAKGGLNLTNISDNDNDGSENSEGRTGFHLGLLAEIPLTARFALQPEVLYSTQGAEVDLEYYYEALGTNDPRMFKLGYIQVPALAKIYLLQDLSIEVGPSFNFLINEEIGGENTSFANFFEFGGALGASYRFGGRFFGSARYTRGFTEIFDGDYGYDSKRNYGFQIGMGLMF